jgi:holliday junction DNA helicase RuvA
MNMIARLRGVIAEITADHLVLDVGGVGYLVLASARTLSTIGMVGETAMLFTDMHVREDALTLFGFGSSEERDWFRLLTSVQGVGGKVALNILSALDAAALTQAISSGDKAMVARANGVGPKLAQRIVMELKDKTARIAIGSAGYAPMVLVGAQADAVSALGNLGFKPTEASGAVAAAQAELGEGASLDALVRLALKKAMR